MKHKWYQIFLGFLAILCMVTTASSAFVMDGGDEYNNGELQTKETSETNYVTFDYNDQETLDFKYYVSSSGSTLDTDIVDSLTPDTSGTSHTFIGWSYTKSGMYADGTSAMVDFDLYPTFSGGETLYAKYYASGAYNFSATQSTDLDIAPANSTSQRKVYISPFSSTITTDAMTITSTINVYYDTAKTAYSEDTTGTSTAVARPTSANVLLVLDTDLIISGGTLKLNCIACSYNGGAFANRITGSFTALDLNGYNIYVRNDGKLLGYGLIYNSKDTGGIIAENGEVKTILSPTDYGGGGKTAVRYINSTLVFSAFLLPYLCCEMICSNQSLLTADCSLYANDEKHSTTVAIILGSTNEDYSSGVFLITKGYMIRRTTPYLELMETANEKNTAAAVTHLSLLDSNYKEEYYLVDDAEAYAESVDTSRTAFYNFNRAQIEINNLTLKLSVGIDVTVSFSDNEFPIASNWKIYVYNCDFGISMPVIFFPGSYLYVDKNSTVNFGNQPGYNNSTSYKVYGRLSFLNTYPSNNVNQAEVKYYYDGTGACISTNVDAYITESFTEPAKMDMEGKFVFNEIASGFLDSTSYYKYYSLGGYINCSDQAVQSLKDNSGVVQLSTFFGFPSYYSNSNGNYDSTFVYYYNQPVISGDKVYFQESACGTILEGNVVEDTPYVYEYNGTYYFYKYSAETTRVQFNDVSTLGLMSTNTPSSGDTNSHYQNFAGAFTACTLTYITDAAGNKTYYVSYTSGSTTTNYLPVGGIMLPLTSGTTPASSTSTFSSYSVATTNRFTLPNGYKYSTNYSLGTTLAYNYATSKWSFAA